NNTYLLSNLMSNPELVEAAGELQLSLHNQSDHLATRISYKLNLRGPSLNVQTACSPTLVAAHLACRSLLDGQCDMALAGGVTVRVPTRSGYFHQEGGVLSPDGHCRAFDQRAEGSVGGDGGGMVVLKRLQDALADGDTVYAVVLGSSVNNDGAGKVGYTAPGVQGQSEAIRGALQSAGIGAESISYLEAHGSGTALGDPIEFEAMTQAFRHSTAQKGFCALSALKSNIGHLDAAAGIAGLIKAVLAFQHRLIPPIVHYRQPNPRIDFDSSPFYPAQEPIPWNGGGTPRRAGVSSFGMGGTNAHLILQEAPQQLSRPASRELQLLVLSARTPAALDQASLNLADHLRRNPEINLADAAYTLQVGRRNFARKRFLVCRTIEEAADALTSPGEAESVGNFPQEQRPVAFLFPGQGTHFEKMGRELYEAEPLFREEMNRCARLLGSPRSSRRSQESGVRSQEEGTGSPRSEGRGRGSSQFAARAPSALFTFEYALAKLWISWGVQPWGMIGHSLGEYAAACLAGVFSLEDALWLVAERGRLMEQIPRGAMLAVPLPEEQLLELLGPSLSLASVNGPSLCVVSGPRQDVEEFHSRLESRQVDCMPLQTGPAGHSQQMEPILEAFRQRVARIRLHSPQIPFLSGLSGDWITDQEATDPDYWVRHLRQTARFEPGLRKLFQDPFPILLEVGPGRSLSSIALQHPQRASGQMAVFSLSPPQDLGPLRRSQKAEPEGEALMKALGRVWMAGAEVDWAALHGEGRRRIALPSYPFERQRYWVEAKIADAAKMPVPPTGEEAAEVAAAGDGAGHRRPELSGEYTAPRSEVESRLASVWQSLFGIEAIGVEDNFFELGGHSLLATQVMSQLQRVFGVGLPLHTIFEAPTISTLALQIEEKTSPKPPPPILPVGRPGRLPLSFAQQRIWFLDRLVPESPFYHLPMAWWVHGNLDPAVLKRSLEAIMRRHEALRTRFPEQVGDPIQAIDPPGPAPLALVDLSHLNNDRWQAEARRASAAESDRAFHLASGPVFRVVLFQFAVRSLQFAVGRSERRNQESGIRSQEEGESERESSASDSRHPTPDSPSGSGTYSLQPTAYSLPRSLLLITMHHIVSDGWSLGLFQKELSVYYEREEARREGLGLPAALPDLEVQYADFALWQRDWMRGEVLDEQLGYWESRLSNAPVLELPLDRPRPAMQAFRGKGVDVAYPPQLAEGLRDLSRGQGGTLFMTLLAAFQALLSRCSGQTDVVVGSLIANRNHPEIEELIGFFVNSLAMRGDLSGDPTFLDVLDQAIQTTLGAYDHQDLPFERLVEHLQPKRDLSRNPIFQVLMVLQNAPEPGLRVSGLEFRQQWAEGRTTRFDIELHFWETPQGLTGSLAYDSDLFDHSSMIRLQRHFGNLLAGIAENPTLRLSELPLLDAAERHQSVSEWA
ncbi:MAG: condensation domain-containing protein, partial [Acidobacteriota bacterium]